MVFSPEIKGRSVGSRWPLDHAGSEGRCECVDHHLGRYALSDLRGPFHIIWNLRRWFTDKRVAIADGVLINVTDEAKNYGFKVPVAITDTSSTAMSQFLPD